MDYKQRMELVRKIGLFGLTDLNKLAPIGDLGYLNAVDFYRGSYPMSGMINDIMKAFWEQKEKNNWTVIGGNTKWRCTDHWSECPELGLRWQIDSGD